MDDLDPIGRLQLLLDNPSKLLEKISRVQSALGSMGAPDSMTKEKTEGLVEPDKAPPVSEAPNPPFGRAVRLLHDMQAQIEDRVLPLARSVAQAEIEKLRELGLQEQAAMKERLAQIDRRIMACGERVRESQRRYAELESLSQRMVGLGSVAEEPSNFKPSQSFSAIMEQRLEFLRREGKI